MICLNHRHCRRHLTVFFVIAVLLILGHSLTVSAETVQPKGTPTSPASIIFGVTWRSGFKTQPHDAKVAINDSVKLSAQGTKSILQNFMPTKYNWWIWTDNTQKWESTGHNDSTYTYTAPSDNPPKQVKVQANFSVGYNIGSNEYWSNVASITVMDHRVAAERIDLEPKELLLANSDTATLNAKITPDNATDPIIWESKNNALASVDSFGTVTTTKANDKHTWSSTDHGQVTITGKTNDQVCSETHLTVGMLQDQTINEGGSVTFRLIGLPKDENGKPKVKVESWHRGKISSDKFEEFKTDQDHFTVPLAMFNQDNDTLYYATLIYTGKGTDGNSRTEKIDTNVAKLTVNNTHDMSLVTVPSFQFGKISLNAFKVPQEMALKAINQRATAQPSLLISDLRQPNQNWQLSAALAPFTSKSGPASSSIAGTIKADLKPVHTLDAKATCITIGPKSGPTIPLRGSQSVAYYLDNSQLRMKFNPRASPGQYHSTITWTLAAVP